MTNPARSERTILALVGAVQFINILDFMIVMPLGPDFALALDIPLHDVPKIGGAYTAAGAVAGLAGSFFLDRFDRRSALVVCLVGLFAGTASAIFATGLNSLLLARVFAGLFGGPASSIAMSIVADVVPPERRGRAMGAIMGMFGAASVFGVPASVELASHFGWRSPFIAVALLGLAISVFVMFAMPPMRAHLDARAADYRATPVWHLLRDPLVIVSYSITLLLMMTNFAIVPILSAYLQFNLGYPRDGLSLLYLCGGSVSIIGMRMIGRQVDRHGAATVSALATACLLVVMWLWFVSYSAAIPVLALFMAYMFTTSLRGVAYQTATSKVPRLEERAGYMSLQSCVSHLAATFGSVGASFVLIERPDGSLAGMDTLAYCAMLGAAAVPAILWHLERRLAARATASLASG